VADIAPTRANAGLQPALINAEAKGMNQRQEDNRFARNVAWGVFCGLWLFAATACAVGAFLWRFLLGPFNV
jgi:hypothetical protein